MPSYQSRRFHDSEGEFKSCTVICLHFVPKMNTLVSLSNVRNTKHASVLIALARVFTRSCDTLERNKKYLNIFNWNVRGPSGTQEEPIADSCRAGDARTSCDDGSCCLCQGQYGVTTVLMLL